MNKNEAIIPDVIGGNNFYYLFSIIDYEGIPVLFVARDDFNCLYLCDCIEFRNFQRWTISKVTVGTLERVINQEITVFEALKEDNNLKIIATYDYNSGHVTQEKIAFADISQEDLPEQDAYAFMVSDDAYDKLCLLSMLLSQINNNNYDNWEHDISVEVIKNSHLEYSIINFEHTSSEKATFFSNEINIALVA